ncbi:hypothetical protein CIL05_20480 [Virgibacillus profundi]|uniref:DUF3993 domain-containing protein n=1 Tax=Virgibacillus profundi TaxID=2024555 RepID=A0A2A2I8T0_9BACI|nr:hypothetical protein [Virgibacillus profundi]PAV27726.1 hypothetical protein CIL05_20480 [Virgibacillus profundi]PXY51881.1 hypothetical protein CIT14_20700 [Virgibacillus profundi]
MKKKHLRISKWIFIIGFILLFLSYNASDFYSASAVSNTGKDHQQIEKQLFKETSIQSLKNEEATIQHDQIVALTDQFMDILVQEIDKNYKVVNYDTKVELLNQFESVSTKEVATPYVDYFYYEEADGLYIVPTETPPWFNEENDYDVIQLEDKKVKVTQDNQDALFGDYTIEYEFTYDNDWKITKINHL